MADRMRWGVIGTGNIARQFASAMSSSTRGAIVAVGSREGAKAAAFAKAQGIPNAYPDYRQVVQDPQVDSVYISLPNAMHREWTIACLRAGKHVLCEKPIAANAPEAEEMFDVAERAGRALMEAFMYRAHPQTLAVQERVNAGAIGKLKLIRTSFCYRTTRLSDNIRFSAELAGGVLMDVGCYCLSFARLFAGSEPVEAHAVGHVHSSGIDDLATGSLRFGAGDDAIFATFNCGMTVQADNTAYLCGSDGYIEIPVPWKPPVHGAQFTIARATPPRMDQHAAGSAAPVSVPPRQTISVDAGVELYAMEADDFTQAVVEGRTPRVSKQDTLGNMRLLDRLRLQIGVSVASRG